MVLREGGHGWTDSQVGTSLIPLNLAGGESVEDLRVLENDEGLGRVLSREETEGMRQRERRALPRRWRKERRGSVPSSSAVFRYLSKFHDEEEETKREQHRAFIPSATDALGGLRRVNSEMVGFFQRHARNTRATLDMDSTLVETHKQEVFCIYKKHKAYQPLSTDWAEADQIVHFVFENGVYEVTGGQKIPGAGTVDFAAIARAAGYRGWRHGRPMADSAGQFIEPHLDDWGIKHYLVETDDDVWLTPKAFRDAQEQTRPVAVLIGTEY